MLISNLIASLQQLEKEGVQEVRISIGMTLKSIDELVLLKTSPVVVLCNNDWMKHVK